MEERLVFYKKNKGMLCDQITVLKRDASFNESEINALKIQIERLKKEKESNQFKIDNFENASKSLDKLIGSQISDNNRKGVGYNAVAPPPTGLFAPPTIDLSSSGLEEFQQPEMVSDNEDEVLSLLLEVIKPKVWSDAPIIEEYESDSEYEHVSLPTEEHETPSFSNQQVKTPRETVKNQFTHSKNPKVDKKGLGYGFITKACFVCGSFSHLIRYCDFHEKRMAKQAELNNRMRKKSTVLTRTGKILVNTARASGTNNDYPHRTSLNKGIVDSGCSRHMTGNKAYLAEYQDFNGGPVAFRRRKLPDENQVLLRIPRQNNMYSFNLKNIVPSGGLACLIAKTTIDESNKWHRRLGHVNFKNLNKIVKGNLVRGDLKKKLNLLRLLCTAIWSFFIFNRSGVQTSKYACEAPNKHHDLTTDDKPATRKKFAKNTRVFAFQAEAAKASSTNIVNTAITPVSTAILMEETACNSRFESLDSCRFALWDEGYWNKMGKRNKKDESLDLKPFRIFLCLCLLHVIHSKSNGFEKCLLYRKIDEEVYVVSPPEILKKFDFVSVKTASTPIETQKPLVKDEEASDVDSVLFRFSVTPKTAHLSAVQKSLGNLDRKSTTGGCQFLAERLFFLAMAKSRQFKATSTTEKNLVCYRKLLWASFL
ncbi:ribonuclease H-like domain-containing protein [Tanacetum coccineum]|uniref:Ribonuclease H-like domain-containing protein n=1 Tax=Tanacetum coccineum TaxID=301880 RepID=A0ABQ5HTS6_9ASTR